MLVEADVAHGLAAETGLEPVEPVRWVAGSGRGGDLTWVPEIPPGGLSLDTLERELILKALERAAGNKSQAARLLGLTRRTLYSRMERHGLRKPGEPEEGGDEESPGDQAANAAGRG